MERWFSSVSITENTKRVLETAAEAAVRSGRRPEDVTVLAATKMNPPEAIREAMAAGITTLGENRVQELVEKYDRGAYTGGSLHFIGSLQKNKVRHLIGKCDLIQSVGTEDVLREVNKRAAAAGIVQDVLLEINIGREPQKAGFLPEAADETAALFAELPAARLCGIMAIPPAGAEMQKTIEYFDAMRKLFIDLLEKKYDNSTVRYLSMGMSSDFAAAIEAGANLVRVGSAIFGPRKYPGTI